MAANLGSSPIQDLPVELLTAIFVLASGTIELSSRQEVIPSTNLLLVSWRWHDIALATPSLWSSLDLDLDGCHDDDERIQRWTRLMSVLLHRSGICPLSLALKDCEFDGRNLETLSIHEQLVLHCHRWKNFSLNSKDELVKHRVFSHARGALNSLQSLTLNLRDWEEPLLLCVTVFENCPSLHYLDTDALMSGDIEIPWHQLTTWISRAPQFPFTFEMLPRCRNLTTLIFEELLTVRELPEDSSRVRALTQILHLSLLSAEEDYHITNILDAIKAPLLKSLKLDSARLGHSSSLSRLVPHIRQFLVHSACNLTSFSAINMPFMDTELISVLQLMPTVSSLILHEGLSYGHSLITWKVLKRLRVQSRAPDDTEPDSGHPLLPQLINLELRVFEETGDWCSALVEAMLSRWTPDRADVTRLKSLRLCTIPSGAFDDVDVFNQLVALKDDGFEFVLV